LTCLAHLMLSLGSNVLQATRHIACGALRCPCITTLSNMQVADAVAVLFLLESLWRSSCWCVACRAIVAEGWNAVVWTGTAGAFPYVKGMATIVSPLHPKSRLM